MSTVASALSLAGTRTSGAPVRTQNGKFSAATRNMRCAVSVNKKFFSAGLFMEICPQEGRGQEAK